jgi:hypothetical protein
MPKNPPSGRATRLAFTLAPHLQMINYRCRLSAFDRVPQHPIKVDGTFA